MTRMIINPGQIFDERRDARQSPESGLVTVSGGSRQQRVDDLLGLWRGQFGFRSRRPLARQGRVPALIPRAFPAVSDLPGDAQTTGYFRGRIILGEQLARPLAAL